MQCCVVLYCSVEGSKCSVFLVLYCSVEGSTGSVV